MGTEAALSNIMATKTLYARSITSSVVLGFALINGNFACGNNDGGGGYISYGVGGTSNQGGSVATNTGGAGGTGGTTNSAGTNSSVGGSLPIGMGTGLGGNPGDPGSIGGGSSTPPGLGAGG